MEVIRQDKFTLYRFPNVFKQSNTYVLELHGTTDVWLFDIGDSREIYTVIGSKKVRGAFLTHSHLDHIFGVVELQKRFPECVFYGAQKCLDWLSDDRRNLSFYYETPLIFIPGHCCQLLDSSKVILFNDIVVEAISTPGHSEDSMSYLLDHMIFTGDAYIPNVKPVTKLKGGNKTDYDISRGKILSRKAEISYILPGHGLIYRNIN